MRTFRFIALAASLALASPLEARAEEAPKTDLTLEAAATFADGQVKPAATISIKRPLYGPIGLNAVGVVVTDYAEALVGAVYSPREWISAAALAGISQAEGTWRLGGTLGLDNDDFSSFTVIEYGESGLWGRSEFAWRPRQPWAGIGFLADTDLGIGPRVEFNLPIPRAVVHFWGAFPGGTAEKRSSALVGLRFDL